MSSVIITNMGLQYGSDRTLYVEWSWDDPNGYLKSTTAGYKVQWWYGVVGAPGFLGSEETTDDWEYQRAYYTAPENAERASVRIMPISKTYKADGVDVLYWTADWCSMSQYQFKNNEPEKPAIPTVEITENLLKATLENTVPASDDENIEIGFEFQIVKDNASQLGKTIFIPVKTRYVVCSTEVALGSVYKVRCRGYRYYRKTEVYVWGQWTDYSENVGTEPAVVKKIASLTAKSSTSVHLTWSASNVAETYDIEYATNKDYLGESNASTVINGIETVAYTITGLETGSEYFFRVRAVNEKGESDWSEAKSIVIGKKPAAPTTRSSTTTAIVGEPLTLFWTHNSVDGSRQSKAQIEVYYGNTKKTHTIDDSANDSSEDIEDVTQYSIDTSTYPAGTTIRWRVRTAGVTEEYSDWSVQRTVNIYASPTLALGVTDASNNTVEQLTSFPIRISATAGPNTQTPLGYHISVISNSSYETIDQVGNPRFVNKGEVVYSAHYDISTKLDTTLSAGDVYFANNATYIITCVVSMNSGLTATSSRSFTVAWEVPEYEPNASIGINKNDFTAYINPYCRYNTGNYVEDVTLDVYRREFDSSFTKLATKLENREGVFVTDPHPALDYARYRIVATSITTGVVRYYDLPAYPVGGKAVLIQWAEEWSNFDNPEETPFAEPVWTGSMLKLPYNIDVSDSNQADVALIEYIGRAHPVSYYGTQIGVSSVWNVEIPKDDKETLYALRRLARWMGDVYVREPSGSGYWANVTVSFSQRHCETTIPVTFNIKRVEGGI